MKHLNDGEVWLACGSQHLYGPETLDEVAANAERVAAGLDAAAGMTVPVRFAGVLTTAEEISALLAEADRSTDCVGVVVWMHTFSPARMWISGLSNLRKPLCHLHTQMERPLPWSTIDMDFMNLHQAAHGDREAGHLHTRMRLARKVVVGHWTDPDTVRSLDAWARAARAWNDLSGSTFARFGDNMRQVAVTEGDKVAAQLRFGFAFDGFGVGDLVDAIATVDPREVDTLIEQYAAEYAVDAELLPGGGRDELLRDGAAIELGLRRFLDEGGQRGFTTNFEDLHGLAQLPGLAVQRLMADGYGFGAEGDWKTAAWLRAIKAATAGRPGGTSFMEDYTYDLGPTEPLVLGAHMLETCPTITSARPTLEAHPLSIGGKADPVRLVFDADPRPAVITCLVDLGNRFRVVTQTVQLVEHPDTPQLRIGKAVWRTAAPFDVATAAWIHAGGSHHTVLSTAADVEVVADLCTIAGVEHVVIDQTCSLDRLQQDLRTNEVFHALTGALGH